MRINTAFFGAFAALLLGSMLTAQTAPEVKCGMMVTSNLTLAADLQCSPLSAAGGALTIVVSGVTVDLNGHTISGAGTGNGVIIAGADDVSVFNGVIRGFAAGVVVTALGPDNPYSPRLTKLRLTGNGVGAYLMGALFGEISDCDVSHNALYGIAMLAGSNYTAVSGNLVFNNGQAGILIGCNPRATDPTGPASACEGLRSAENTVEGNSVVANGWSKGTESQGKAGITISFGDRNLVRRNLVIDNNTTSEGGQLNVTSGILVVGADNVIADNQVINNGRGIHVALYPSVPVQYAVNTVVSGNSVLHNASSGVLVRADGATGTVIRDNIVIANGLVEETGFGVPCRSGIRVQSGGASLMNNVSHSNFAFGFVVETKDIKAQFGNRAENNGESSQCSGLTCQQ